ncbi:alpha/beta hydrolase [Massilia sp. YIM B02769]|uniref:alpha/beta fold hydrolase n=1 Tax=unclassified Massilia TaxID=2609279 RepID=UPI0025B6EE1D|nr:MULTISPECIES: alpha/beta hydrolase [unclassified Massilia]MDN4057175.1 alpha/beta hydrolase [Massilia sp. YIM B02769]
MTPSRSEFLTVRGLRTHVRHWGREGAPKIFMAHGWMDMSASFQFIVDCLEGDWHVIAHDWRGFGLTERTGTDTYWFPDYVADLDFLLDHYAPNEPVNLLGHSMGGNAVSLYAGVRPQRVAKLINLEGIGLQGSVPEQAPKRMARWLDELKTPPVMRGYASLEEVAARLKKTNPRLPEDRAAFLAEHWSARNEAGEYEILGDPAHKMSGPLLYHLDEMVAIWKKISAPVLWIEAAETDMWRWMGPQDGMRAEVDSRLAHMASVEAHIVPEAGHMVHHDQPRVLARLIEAFLGR